jgi:hypothetical protein
MIRTVGYVNHRREACGKLLTVLTYFFDHHEEEKIRIRERVDTCSYNKKEQWNLET